MTGESIAPILASIAAVITALTPGLIVVLRRQHQTIKRQDQTISGVSEALRILRGNGEGSLDEMLEAVLLEQRDMRARQERMDERDNVTDQRLGRLEARVEGISRHQRQDRETLHTIQAASSSVKDAAAVTAAKVGELDTALTAVREDLEGEKKELRGQLSLLVVEALAEHFPGVDLAALLGPEDADPDGGG